MTLSQQRKAFTREAFAFKTSEINMSAKRKARLAYYEGIKDAMVENLAVTEQGLRDLEGMSEAKVEKIVASLRKLHEKLMKQIDRQILNETRP
jgi:hypothetical protein